MGSSNRPSPRPVFLEQARRLNVKFYTSNLEKYLQAKVVFEKFGLVLQHFKSRTDPYAEHYELGKEQLLGNAIDEIKSVVGRTSLFFVEDTSLRIEALSSGEEDFPGLKVKEWFASTPFESLDGQLPNDPEGRRGIVKSDIALHVPGFLDPVMFHGETAGTIASTAPLFEENAYHPWLTPHSFNGWFVPDGAARRLGEMSLDESWEYDFRVRALVSLVLRLEEYAAILNAPRDCYTVMPTISPVTNQASLFSSVGNALVVVGRTCAGKSTFGLLATREVEQITVIEASDVLRSFIRRRDQHLSAFEFAKQLLSEQGPDVVARRLVQIYRLGDSANFLITGFRTIEELEVIRQLRTDLKIVLVEASGRTRYARHLARGRELRISYKEFLEHDAKQWAFGLLPVAEDLADIRITNEGSLEDYRAQVLAVLRGPEAVPGVTVNVGPRHDLHVHRLFRCLSILAAAGRAMTCEEIEHLTTHWAQGDGIQVRRGSTPRYSGKRITHNNVNKVLKKVPELAQRMEVQFDRVRYRITDAGRAYLRLMQVYAARRERRA